MSSVLVELREAGLDSLPGGGAEIFAPRVRRKICHDKCDGDRYLFIHRTAHRLGMRTNVTMLYGHIETMEERVDHLVPHSRSAGRYEGIPGVHPAGVSSRQQPDAKAAAAHGERHTACPRCGRLMLDNVDHIKAYWISSGVEVAQTALWFGADDLDGTVQEETIYHMAGSRTPSALSTSEIESADRRCRAAGRSNATRSTTWCARRTSWRPRHDDTDLRARATACRHVV